MLGLEFSNYDRLSGQESPYLYFPRVRITLHEHAVMPAVCSCVIVHVYACRWSEENHMGFLLLCLPISFFEAESLTDPGTQRFAYTG